MLEYIKINNTKYVFNHGATCIIAKQDSGKSMLFELLEFIFGKNKIDRTKDSFDKLYMENPPKIMWKFSYFKCEFILDYNSKKVLYNNQELSIKEYSEKICGVEDFCHKVILTNLKTYPVFLYNYSPTSIKKNQRSLFINNNSSSTYTALKLLYLFDSSINMYNEYFLLVAKEENMRKLNRVLDQDKKLVLESIDSEEAEVIEKCKKIIESNINYYSEITKIRKIKERNLNNEFLNEIIKLFPEKNIEKINTFHQNQITQFNHLIDVRMQELEKNDEIISEIGINTVKKIVKDIEMKTENANNLKAWSKYISENREKIISLEEKLSKINDILKNYCILQNSKIIESNITSLSFDIQMDSKYKKITTSILQNIGKSGDGDITINFFNYMSKILLESNFPFMAFEVISTAEIDHSKRVKFINETHEILSKHRKQSVFFLHPQEENLDLSCNIFHIGDDKIFEHIFEVEV